MSPRGPLSMLVTGGTGTLGRCVVPLLQTRGHVVRVLSRAHHEPGDGIDHRRGDLTTGEGVDDAVADVDVILHLAGSRKGDEDTTRALVRAAAAQGSPHLVYISVVGAERIPIESAIDRACFGYFGAKRAAERVVAESGLRWTVLRATQFHQSFLQVARSMARMPVLPAPPVRFQPVDAREVAVRLADLAEGPPNGLEGDFGGPLVYPMKELLRGYLRSRRKHRLLMPVPLFGRAAAAIESGANLTRGPGDGHVTWEDFLAESLDGREAEIARV